MKKFKITYDHQVFKPSNLSIFERQQNFKLIIEAIDFQDAKIILKTKHNKNPFYFKISETI